MYLPRYLLTSESERVVREPELAVWLVNPPVSTVGGTEAVIGRSDVAPPGQGRPGDSPAVELNTTFLTKREEKEISQTCNLFFSGFVTKKEDRSDF